METKKVTICLKSFYFNKQSIMYTTGLRYKSKENLYTNYMHYIICISLTIFYFYIQYFLVTVASSGTDEVGKNFLHLKILYDEDGITKSIFTEMNLNQFYKFLHDLEKAKNSLDILV